MTWQDADFAWRPPRILVVDGEPRLAEMVACVLEFIGYQAAAYADPHEALEAFGGGGSHDLLIAGNLPASEADRLVDWVGALRPRMPVIRLEGRVRTADLEAMVERALAARSTWN